MTATPSPTVASGETPSPERRRHHRVAIRLPLLCRCPGRGEPLPAATANVSAGGIYFEIDLPGGPKPAADALSPPGSLDVEMTVPPGQGHFPYESRVHAGVEILRRRELPGDPQRPGAGRIGLAGRFDRPLRLTFLDPF